MAPVATVASAADAARFHQTCSFPPAAVAKSVTGVPGIAAQPAGGVKVALLPAVSITTSPMSLVR